MTQQDDNNIAILKVSAECCVITDEEFEENQCYRVIEIPSSKTLSDLAEFIVFQCFEFFDFHGYGFYCPSFWDSKRTEEYDDGIWESSGKPLDPGVIRGYPKLTTIGSAFNKGKIMDFLYDIFFFCNLFWIWLILKKNWIRFDFGDEWHFEVECLDVKPKTPRARHPKITQKVGQNPPQYPPMDEEEGEYMEEEEGEEEGNWGFVSEFLCKKIIYRYLDAFLHRFCCCLVACPIFDFVVFIGNRWAMCERIWKKEHKFLWYFEVFPIWTGLQ